MKEQTDTRYVDLLVAGTDNVAQVHLTTLADGVPNDLPHRETMRAVLTLVSVFVSPTSRWHGDPTVVVVMHSLLDHLESIQGPNGLFDGDNLSSPPDSSFTINDLCLADEIIERHGAAELASVSERLTSIASRAIPALILGGVHTPNHRWELCSALARLNSRWPNAAIPPRIDDWLAEGIDVDASGIYSERSPNYAAYVSNPSLLSVARLHGRPDLLDIVRANLRATTALTEADGEVETIQSRRQDQRERFSVSSFLSQFRWFAIQDDDAEFSRVTDAIVGAGLREPERHLAELLVEPILARPLPVPSTYANEATTWFPTIGLARSRSDAVSLTVFGGSDFGRTRRIASGLSNSAVFLRMRSGAAILDSVRLSPQFFDLGAFRASSIEPDNGNYILRERRISGYYQPLQAEDLSSTGDYDLTDEGRFFGSMSFPKRDLSMLSLDTTVVVTPRDDGADIAVTFDGALTDYSLELVFRDGGVLSGVESHGDGYQLRGGTGTYRVGNDSIRFCPAEESHIANARPPRFDEGEMFEYVGGNDRIPGTRVLIGGTTGEPFVLSLRSGAAT